jgi:hypothetical protein
MVDKGGFNFSFNSSDGVRLLFHFSFRVGSSQKAL